MQEIIEKLQEAQKLLDDYAESREGLTGESGVWMMQKDLKKIIEDAEVLKEEME